MDVVNKEMVFSVMKREALPVYYVYSADSKSLYASQENSAMPIDQVIEQLNFDLDQCMGRYVVVEARKTNSEEQGRGGDIRNRKIYRYKVNTSQQSQQQPLNGYQEQSNSTMQLMQRIGELEKKIIEQQFEFKHQELLREMREIKEESKNPLVDQVVNTFLAQYSKLPQARQAAPIAGAAPDETQQVTDVKTRAKLCLGMMKKIDPTFEKFQRILEFATANPDQFNVLVSHIENQKNG